MSSRDSSITVLDIYNDFVKLEQYVEALIKRLSNEKCSETASRTDEAKVFDNAIGEGGFLTMAVDSTSVERHARGEKTINVAGSSLKDATAKSTGAI